MNRRFFRSLAVLVCLMPGPLGIVPAFGSGGPRWAHGPESPTAQAHLDIMVWQDILAMAQTDGRPIPKGEAIDSIFNWAVQQGYVTRDVPILIDPWGRPYQVHFLGDSLVIFSRGPDGQAHTPDDIRSQTLSRHAVSPPPQESTRPAAPRKETAPAAVCAGAGTCLTVAKSGADLVLSWTNLGTTYDGAASTDARFYNVRTLFLALTSTTWTWSRMPSPTRPMTPLFSLT